MFFQGGGEKGPGTQNINKKLIFIYNLTTCNLAYYIYRKEFGSSVSHKSKHLLTYFFPLICFLSMTTIRVYVVFACMDIKEFIHASHYLGK